MLKGEYQPEPPLSIGRQVLRQVLRLLGLVESVHTGLFLGVVLVFGIALVFWGLVLLFGWGRRINLADAIAWIFLIGGVAIVAVSITALAGMWRRSWPTIQRFEYDRGVLTYFVGKSHLATSRMVEEVAELSEEYGSARSLLGYWISFRDGMMVFVSLRVTHAEELFAALNQSVGARDLVKDQ